MFDLTQQVRLKQAKNALQDGRLDEAFAIANEKEIRELRGGQILLEELVQPYLDRAARHLADGRPQDALRDVERSIAAGGDRPEALRLRREAEQAVEERERARRRDLELVASARKHLRDGSLRAGQALLKDASPTLSAAGRLQREAEHLERHVERALARASEHLGRGEIIEALASVEEVIGECKQHDELPDLLFRIKKAAVSQVREALDGGNLRVASGLFVRLKAVAAESLEIRALEEPMELAREARAAYSRLDHQAALIALTRLFRLLPGAGWIEECRQALEKVDSAFTVLRASPLADSGGARGPGELLDSGAKAMTLTIPPPRPAGAAQALPMAGAAPAVPMAGAAPAMGQGQRARGHGASPHLSRLLLWVDGVGTYLILTSDRITIGRAGASSHPDIALAADLAGREAEIIRVEDDYFILGSQNAVQVDGRPTRRKLLSNGENIDLGNSGRITFRLPTPLCSTAVLSLHKGQRIHGDVRTVLLLKEHLVLGSGGKCHVEVKAGEEQPIQDRIVISMNPKGLVCRAQQDILVAGENAGRETAIPLGARIQIGEVSFTITDSVGGRA